MNLSSAMELESNLCAKLPVGKLRCSFDVSYCVITQDVADMIRQYRVIVLPILRQRGFRRDTVIPSRLLTPEFSSLLCQVYDEWTNRSG
jgi:hypothetical protein